jgi:hypothetical protein
MSTMSHTLDPITEPLPGSSSAVQPIPSHPRAAVRAGALAVGATALGALAVGALAVGRLAIGRARIRRLEIGELVVQRLRVTEDLRAPSTPAPAT